MSAQPCPTCGILVEKTSLSCGACGARMHDGSTWPTPLQPLPAGASGGALWLDDLGGTEVGPEARPLDLTFELREIKQPLLPPGAALPTLRSASRPLARPPADAAGAAPVPPPLPRGAPLLPPLPPPRPAAAQPVARPAAVEARATVPPPVAPAAPAVDPPPAAWRTAPPHPDVPPAAASAPALAQPHQVAPTPAPPAPWHEATPEIDWPVFEELPDLHPSQLEPPIVLPAPELPPPTRRPPIAPPQALAAPFQASPIQPPPVLRGVLATPATAAAPAADPGVPPLPSPLAPLYAEARRPPPAAAARPATEAPSADELARRRANKVAARGAVRRARLQNVAAQLSTAPEILVLDRDAGARYELCALLQAFGFQVQATADTAEAAALAASGRFAAAFVDVALDAADGGTGIELCRRVRESNQRQGGAGTLLVLVAAQLRPLDRVRADLAGCDEAIVKPVSRGSVAKVLDERGIPLPSDARRV